MKNENLNEIKKELLDDVIPNLKKYKEQGKDMVLLKGIAIGLKIAKEEKTAQSNGLKAFSDTQKKINLYFGAVIYNSRGEKKVIPNFVEYRKAYLEKDISEANKQISSRKSLLGNSETDEESGTHYKTELSVIENGKRDMQQLKQDIIYLIGQLNELLSEIDD